MEYTYCTLESGARVRCLEVAELFAHFQTAHLVERPEEYLLWVGRKGDIQECLKWQGFYLRNPGVEPKRLTVAFVDGPVERAYNAGWSKIIKPWWGGNTKGA